MFGLLRMPRMPELKNRRVDGFAPDRRVAGDAGAIDNIKYKYAETSHSARSF